MTYNAHREPFVPRLLVSTCPIQWVCQCILIKCVFLGHFLPPLLNLAASSKTLMVCLFLSFSLFHCHITHTHTHTNKSGTGENPAAMQHGDHGNAVLVASHIHLPLAVVTYQVINFVLNMHWVHCTRRPAMPTTNAPLYVERRMGRKLQNKNKNKNQHTQTNRNRYAVA